ncbi:hypothetical protein JCM10908_000166 [Rhodotorula pacifica]|uniref:uncharacterized protein n=1 Tax=Rhodotorula pacifica TaxID=1495444 RepID=UPI0031736FBC
MADIFTDLLQKTLRDLPSDANPWSVIRGALTAKVRPVAPHHIIAQLYALSAGVAVVTLLLAACLFVKHRQGTLWLVRTHRATGGTYLVVHYSNGWTTTFLLFLGVLQGYIWQTVYYNQGKWVPHSDLWREVVWIPGWTAFWFASWSLCVSHILHLDSSGRPARSFYAQAWFVNTVAILVPSVAAVVVAILAWQAHSRYWDSLEAYKAIDAALVDLASNYNGTFDQSIISSGSGGQLVVEFTSKLSEFGDYFRWVFVTYLICSMILEMVLCTTAFLHLRELRKTMDELHARARVSEEARAQETMIKHGYQSLSFITWSIIAACTAINALFLFVAAAGPKVVYDEKYSEVASLLPLWLFSVLGLPLATLFLRRLLKQGPPRPSADTASNVELPGLHTSRPPSIGAKEDNAYEAYPMEKLSSLHYAQNPQNATTSLDSEVAESRDTASPLVSQTPPPGFQQAFYSSYSSRPSQSDESQLSTSQK